MASRSDGRDAIDAAKRRLQAAKRRKKNAAEALALAETEVEDALSSLEEAYQRSCRLCPSTGEDDEEAEVTDDGENEGRGADDDDDNEEEERRDDEVRVEGAGTAEVDGTYKLRQSRDGLPVYVDENYPVFSMEGSWEGKPVEYVIYRAKSEGEGFCSWWIISCLWCSDNVERQFFCYQSPFKADQTLPPESGWTNQDPMEWLQGDGPAPRLKCRTAANSSSEAEGKEEHEALLLLKRRRWRRARRKRREEEMAESEKEKGAEDEDASESREGSSDTPKKRKKKTKKDPNAPKRNQSSFFLYSNAMRNDVKAANPDARSGEIAQIISRYFKALPQEERAYWDQKAAEDEERYEREMAIYRGEAEDTKGNEMEEETVWQCDICKEMEFDTYEECAAHERECANADAARGGGHDSSESSQDMSATVAMIQEPERQDKRGVCS